MGEQLVEEFRDEVHQSSFGPLKLFERNGQTFCDGLYRMHAEMGFPLTDSINECRNRGWIPCVEQFIHDAVMDWKDVPTTEAKERARRIVDSAMADAAGIVGHK